MTFKLTIHTCKPNENPQKKEWNGLTISRLMVALEIAFHSAQEPFPCNWWTRSSLLKVKTKGQLVSYSSSSRHFIVTVEQEGGLKTD